MPKLRAAAKAPTDYGRRVLETMEACGYPSQQEFAKALGIQPQQLRNWVARDSPGTGAAQLKSLTGVSVDWLLSGTGSQFTNGGPISYRASAKPGRVSEDRAGYALTVNRLENDVDALRNALLAVVETLIVTTPGATSGLYELLRQTDQRFHSHGFHGQLLALLARSQKTAGAAPRGAPRRAGGGSSRRGVAS